MLSLGKDLFASLGVDAKFAQDPLLGEYVNDKLFGEHSVNSPSSNVLLQTGCINNYGDNKLSASIAPAKIE